ncbi:S-layer homology domain-containing protein [Paenibacillus sp. 1_12]|uniref:S-layer homology domain-containing protein n=1 Tax=Paenibacillus sp. 1_12 TaxID=1566278 RepID=UPI0008E8758A|nr:S-layer homology domain-containing protein [Paenibacillus sp. 1_12]SFK98131.1 S-layer homology domain-containing protein [Paenibacillus sp. 1_12]
MRIRKNASTAALATVLLFSNIPLAMADEAIPAAFSSKPIAVPLGGSAVTPGDAKVSKDQAIELAKSYVTIPDGYTVDSVNLSSNSYNGRGVSWNISFRKLVEGKNVGNINITIHGMNGKLLEYYFYSNDLDYKPSYPPKVDFKGAKGIANEWVARLNANESSQLQYNDSLEQSLKAPLNGSFQYSIRYDRTHNGVPFPQNGINIQVNGDGVVTQYSFNWDEASTFEQATPISDEAAAKAFRDKLNPKLNYLMLNDVKGERKPIVAYTMEHPVLNAATGEVWKQGLNSNFSQELEKPLTNAPLSESPTSNLNLTKEQALEKVSSTFKLPEGIKLEEASYNESTNPITGEVQSIWNLRWNDAKDDSTARRGTNIWASVNNKTGEIMNYSRNNDIPFGEQKPVEPKVTLEEAKAKAIDFIKQQLPAYTDQLVVDTAALANLDYIPTEQKKMITAWDLSFKRMIDGVYVNYENVHIAVDKATGDITNYQFNFSNIAYPKQKPEVIDLSKAKELLLSTNTIKLNYVLPNQGFGIMPIEKIRVMMAAGELPPGSDTSDKEAKLVYVLQPKYIGENYFLDAVTGQWRNSSSGEVMSLEKVHVTDIEGHYAQRELQIMLDYQALDVTDGKVNPDASITRGELVKMLVIAMNGGRSGLYYGADRAASFKDVKNESPLFAYVENAVDRGLIQRGKDFNPQAIMNREDMAELIVGALGYKKLTAYANIFSDKFGDADLLKNRGEAALVVGLGIMSLSEGSFKPKQEVTRAQAAAAFYRYLEKATELGNRYY